MHTDLHPCGKGLENNIGVSYQIQINFELICGFEADNVGD